MIHLVAPPGQHGGVYDFACKLQEAIGKTRARLVHLSEAAAATWVTDPDDIVILQFSGYGFQKRGAPLWLLRDLERRRRQFRSLGIFFHELYAFGPPWSSSFWLSPVQRHIARRLAEMSDFWMTSREGSAKWLLSHAGDKPHAVLPVFSTIGEPDSLAQVRLPRIVVFGSAGLRQATYRAAGDRLFAWASQASLEIHDIGAPISDKPLADTLHANDVIQHGRLDDEAVRHLMENALFGLLAYPVGYVAKSSVFAAYCAHGVCPILLSAEHRDADGLKAAIHYLPHLPDPSTAADFDSTRQAAWEWYQPHSTTRHAETLNEFFDLNSRIAKC